MSAAKPLPTEYRPCVGLMILNVHGQVWIGRRAGQEKLKGGDEVGEVPPMWWQMPQGGIDTGESPLQAAYRELHEETGILASAVDVIAESSDWLTYDLPPQLLTQMYYFVSSALKRELLKRSEMLDPALIDEAVDANRAKILSRAMSEAKADVSSAQRFIEDRVRSGTLNESLLKDLIEARRSTEFLLGFAHYVGVDPSTAQRILADRTWESIALACRAAGLERTTFAKIVFGLQRGEDEQNKALRILDLYLKVPQEAAERVMRFWRLRTEQPPAEAEPASAQKTPSRPSIHAIAERLAQKG